MVWYGIVDRWTDGMVDGWTCELTNRDTPALHYYYYFYDLLDKRFPDINLAYGLKLTDDSPNGCLYGVARSNNYAGFFLRCLSECC